MAKSSQPERNLVAWTKEWERLRSQKHRHNGGVEARMLLSLGTYFGEHGIVQTKDALQQRAVAKDGAKNRLSLVFNMVRKSARRRMGRIWSVSPEFSASPNKIDPRAFDNADIVNDLIRALDFKLREKSTHWRRVWWLVLTGVCIEHTPWIEDSVDEPIPAFDPETNELLWREAQSGKVMPQSFVDRLITEAGFPPERFTPVEHLTTVGDVGSQILSPFNFFIDSAVTSIKELPPEQAVYIAEVKSLDWIKEVFGADTAEKVSSKPGDDLAVIKTRMLDKGPALSSMNLRDMLPAIQGSRSHDDPPMAIVLTRYQGACEQYPRGQRSMIVPGQAILDTDALEYGEIPCTDFHYSAPTVSFWTDDFITDLIPAQKFYNKRFSQAGEAANATIHEILLLGPGIGKDDIPADMPGVVPNALSEQGSPMVVPLAHRELPPWFLELTREVANFMDSVGGSDLTQHKQFPGQIRGPLALPMLQEILDSEDGPFFSHLGEQLSLVKQQRINRVKQFYPPIRTLHYTGRNNRDEVLVFHKEEILKSGTEYTIKVDQSSLVPELSALRRARVIEDLSGPAAILYTDRRTGKLDASKIAIAMKYQDAHIEDRQAQYRKLAQHLIARLWQAEPLPENIPLPFWDHATILDELEASMATTEYLEASPQCQQVFVDFYERCRNYLAAIQQSQFDAVQNQMLQGAVAQATQQAAAKAASVATDAALAQIDAQAQEAQVMPPSQRLAQTMDRPLTPGPSRPQ